MNATINSIVIFVAFTDSYLIAHTMTRAFIQTVDSGTIVSTPSSVLITLAVVHRVVFYAFSIRFSFSVRTVVFAPVMATIWTYEIISTLAICVETVSMERTVVLKLRIDGINVHENERVWTILELTSFSIVSILARASTCVTTTIPIAIFPAIIQWQ